MGILGKSVGEHERVFGKWLLAALGAVALGALILPACSSSDGGGGGGSTCSGVIVAGECQAKCDETKCVETGMKCVNNACEQPCTAHSDCPAGKLCYGTTTDDGVSGQFCDVAPFAQNDGGIGQYEPCEAVDGGSADDQCDTARGYKCIDGVCKLTGCVTNADCATVPGYCIQGTTGNAADNYCSKVDFGKKCATTAECGGDPHLGCVNGECAFVGCKTHTDCASIGLCQGAKDDTGKDVLACVKGTTYPKGQFGTPCPAGKDGTDCDATNGFVCVGTIGDIDAYCTKSGCQKDDDCATGYFCATVRTGKVPCQTNCGIPGSSSTTGCVASADIGPGKEYSCGPVSLLRNLCMKRGYCNDCATDDDCRAVANQICAKDDKGVKHCTVPCDENVSNACPWGSASECKISDTTVGKATCSHRFGACTGAGKSCEPCIDDSDCPGGLCIDTLSGERYCVDLGPSCDCTGLPTEQGVQCVDGGCPKTPGGLFMACYGGSAVPSTSPLFKKCLAGNINTNPNASPKNGCWPLQ